MGENAEGNSPVQGEDNLYVHDTTTGATAFIGALAAGDSALWSLATPQGVVPAQATPDGRFLAFQSYADLTPDKTSTTQAVYEYDAAAATLTRVSIGQGGYGDDLSVHGVSPS